VLHYTRLERLEGTNTLAYWVHSKVTNKMKCCEYGPIGRTATDKTKVRGLNPGTGREIKDKTDDKNIKQTIDCNCLK
jgi:hypothetical protein